MEKYKTIKRWDSFVNEMSSRKGRFPEPRNGMKYIVEESDDPKSMEKLEDFLNFHLHLDRLIKVKHSWVGGDGKRFYEIEGIPRRYYEWRDFSDALELPNIKHRQRPNRAGITIKRTTLEDKIKEKLSAKFRLQYPKVKENIIRQMVERELVRLSI